MNIKDIVTGLALTFTVAVGAKLTKVYDNECDKKYGDDINIIQCAFGSADMLNQKAHEVMQGRIAANENAVLDQFSRDPTTVSVKYSADFSNEEKEQCNWALQQTSYIDASAGRPHDHEIQYRSNVSDYMSCLENNRNDSESLDL